MSKSSIWGIIFLFICKVSWSNVPWTIVPITNTTISLPSNVTATVSYTVTNVSGATRTFAMKPIPGVTQTTTGTGICSNPFILGNNGSCVLTLVIPGNQLTAPITSGPEVCIATSNGQPDSQLCYRPENQSLCLHITSTSAAVLGQSLGGGTVACLDGTPYLNLIVATTDNSTGIPWEGTGIAVPNANSSDDGATNTTSIVNCLTNSEGTGCPPVGGAISASSYAAGICSEYRGGGYTDWFLPAQNQLACLCTNQAVLGTPPLVSYWSSSQYDSDNAFNIYFHDGNGCDQHADDKGTPFNVRCVRILTL